MNPVSTFHPMDSSGPAELPLLTLGVASLGQKSWLKNRKAARQTCRTATEPQFADILPTDGLHSPPEAPSDLASPQTLLPRLLPAFDIHPFESLKNARTRHRHWTAE